jgi:hypothetical protein
MSFKRRRKVYKLDFSGTEYDGLEVKVRGLTTGEYLDIVSLGATAEEGGKETEKLLLLFSSHLVSWNLTDGDDDEPVPTDFEGVKSNDFTMNTFIINAWTDAIASVPAGTEKKLPAGESSPTASIPTETL